MGIPSLTHPETIKKLDFYGMQGIDHRKAYRIKNFLIRAIPVPHGDCPCFSYVIDCSDGNRILFITDASDFPTKVPNVTHLMIEANYSMDIIERNAVKDQWNFSASNTHMSLEKATEVIERHKSASLQTVTLLHLSAGNSNAKEFVQYVEKETGITPYIADKGVVIDFKKEEF